MRNALTKTPHDRPHTRRSCRRGRRALTAVAGWALAGAVKELARRAVELWLDT